MKASLELCKLTESFPERAHVQKDRRRVVPPLPSDNDASKIPSDPQVRVLQKIIMASSDHASL